MKLYVMPLEISIQVGLKIIKDIQKNKFISIRYNGYFDAYEINADKLYTIIITYGDKMPNKSRLKMIQAHLNYRDILIETGDKMIYHNKQRSLSTSITNFLIK